ncbi:MULTISPECIES: transcription antitermination factor NusB [unclassified Neptuniibacter]|jgi:N utilization substance protein B|uniref:transcription antitermination factor NusB n=1 Tax=unclassified Neptuniibacter TaxID=2630693 RepID=UPI0026E3405C|nr:MULTISPECIES: transcription antitermination factor NusB [unclassified Neptuniibacter]MDO6513815.1 transcription antitermination factor NusB [Neptuniibacter sp. 2_MG-2023]MDO6593225.1 transcription antitermination factor NusB [Neptuniibacter sp. 1_MG-2023]
MSDNENKPATKKKPSLTTQRRNARSYALQALYQWEIAGQPVNEIEAQFRVDNDMRDTDIKLFSELLHGIAGAKSDLDKSYLDFLDRQVEELDPIELTVLRIGAFELAQRIEVPYRVAINESVELAKKFGATDSHRYVNGVLDKLAQRVRMAEIRDQRQRKS